MPIVNFDGTRVNVPDDVLSNPQELENIHRQVSFLKNVDTGSGANWQARTAMAGVESDADKRNALKRFYSDAEKVGDNWIVRDRQGRNIQADEQGFAAKDLIDLMPDVGSIGGSILGAIGGAALGAPTGPGAVASAMAGSGLGAAAGHEGAMKLARFIGGSEDTRSSLERLVDVGGEMALGAAGEGVGRALGAGVGALRQAPTAADQGIKGVASLLDLPLSSGMVGSPTGGAVENFAARSLAGRGGLQRQAADLNEKLGTVWEDFTPPEKPGWQSVNLLQGEEGAKRRELLHQYGTSLGKEIPTELPPPKSAPLEGLDDNASKLFRTAQTEEQAAQFAYDEQKIAHQLFRYVGTDPETGEFSAAHFARQWKQLDPRDKYFMGQKTGMTKELNAVVPVILRAAEFSKRAGATKETPLGSINQLFGLGGIPALAAGWHMGAIGMLAPAVAASVFRSKPMLRWLATAPKNPGAWTKHLSKLAVMAEGDDVARAVYDALTQQNSQEK